MKSNQKISILLRVSALLAVLGVIACSSISKILDPPKVELASFKVMDIRDSAVFLQFGLRVENPNRMAIKVDRVNYELEVNERKVLVDKLENPIEIPGRASAIMSIPVKLKLFDLVNSLSALLSDGSVKYRLKGIAESGLLRVPFDKSGEFKLKKESDEKIQ